MKRLILIIFLLTSGLTQAQNNPDIKRTMNWYFGWGVGIDFTSGSPVAHTRNDRNYTGNLMDDYNSGRQPAEAVLSESDTCGNLLFYCNDIGIFLENGDTLQHFNPRIAGPTQIIAVPKPGNDSIYYFFYSLNGWPPYIYQPFCYGILNIKDPLNPELSWNNTMFEWSTEMVAAYRHCNGQDIWIVNKKKNSIDLMAWLLTPSGLSDVPVVSSVIDLDTLTEEENGSSFIRFSPDGRFAAVMIRKTPNPWVDTYINLFRFDPCTGMFSDRIVVYFPGGYGLCFSPGSTKLYAGGHAESWYFPPYSPLVQFDLSDYGQAAVEGSWEAIYGNSHFDYFEAMQLGPDGKIYVVDLDLTDSTYVGALHLGVIHDPDAKGLLCNYTPEQFYLSGREHTIGIPYFPDFYFRSYQYSNCNGTTNPPDTSGNQHVYVPNIFSPNGDGNNDVLWVRGEDVTEMQFRIYNRWGCQVFESRDISSGWDGTYQGKAAEQGVFFYTLSITFRRGEQRSITGNVTLIR